MTWRKIGRRIQFRFSKEPLPQPSMNAKDAQGLFDWLQKAQQGEDGAFDTLMGLCEYRLLSLGRGFSRLMKGKEGTNDLVQESLVILYSKILEQQFSSKRHLESYLAHLINNIRMNRYKKMWLTAKRKIGLEVSGVESIEDVQAKNPSSEFEKGEELEKMADALKILNNKESTILRMRHQDGMTWEEIGRNAGISADCARKAHGRIIGLLRSAMGLPVKVDWVD